MPSDQSRIIEQGKLTYFSLDKAFEKQIKTIEDKEMKQVETLKSLKQEENKENMKSVEEIFLNEMKTN